MASTSSTTGTGLHPGDTPSLPTTCVLPAAGLATRFGGPKLLALLDGRPLVDHAVRNAAEACESVIVVVGSRAGPIREAVPDLDGVSVIENPDFASGMLSSIRVGARAVRTDRFFVAPGDMPFLDAVLFRAVWRAAEGRPQSDAWYPFRDGRRGHPVLIRSSLAAALERSRARSMRAFLEAYHETRVRIDSDRPFIDLDTPADLERFREERPE
jgi:molybdenum cofactor cytidylyltransferase